MTSCTILEFTVTKIASVCLSQESEWLSYGFKYPSTLVVFAYIRLLHAMLYISWSGHPTEQRLYQNVPTFSSTIQEWRLWFAGYCRRELKKNLWIPNHGSTAAGRPWIMYIQQLAENVGCQDGDLVYLGSQRAVVRLAWMMPQVLKK